MTLNRQPNQDSFAEICRWIDGVFRKARNNRRKEWVEKWWATSMGLTVKEWREAQAAVEAGIKPAKRGYLVPVCPRKAI